jgi:hypothetical protein
MSTTPRHLRAAPLDALRDSLFAARWPGLKSAFDAASVRDLLQHALFRGPSANHSIERCTLDSGMYLPAEDRCNFSYVLDVRNRESGSTFPSLVGARIFPSASACESYVRDRLAPLAALAAGRTELAPFSTPVAMLEPLNMAVSVFPIDGELPALIDATDSERMTEVFRGLLPRVLADDVAVESCRVEVCQYRRRRRCVLRYHVDCRSAGRTEPVVVYGKVHADRDDKIAVEAMEALREKALGSARVHRFNIPRPLGFGEDPRLTLLEAIPGRRRISRLLKKRLRGASDSKSKLTLEESLEACARIATVLHTSGVALGPRRTLEEELTDLRHGIASIEPVSPALAEQLLSWQEQIRARAGTTRPLRLCFSHGDFKHSQLLFDGKVSGLVDFDTVCQAEPARDLGQFQAYLRISVLRIQGIAGAALADQLCRGFLDAYVGYGGALEAEERLRSRVALYEASTLVRVAVKSWHKFKGDRLEHAIAILKQRIPPSAPPPPT